MQLLGLSSLSIINLEGLFLDFHRKFSNEFIGYGEVGGLIDQNLSVQKQGKNLIFFLILLVLYFIVLMYESERVYRKLYN